MVIIENKALFLLLSQIFPLKLLAAKQEEWVIYNWEGHPAT